jgi:hypothetical protein
MLLWRRCPREQRPDVGRGSVRRVGRPIVLAVRDDGQESVDDDGVELPACAASELAAGDLGRDDPAVPRVSASSWPNMRVRRGIMGAYGEKASSAWASERRPRDGLAADLPRKPAHSL